MPKFIVELERAERKLDCDDFEECKDLCTPTHHFFPCPIVAMRGYQEIPIDVEMLKEAILLTRNGTIFRGLKITRVE